MSTYRNLENKPYMHAMNEIKRSSKASPFDNRPKRLRTKQTVLKREMKDSA